MPVGLSDGLVSRVSKFPDCIGKLSPLSGLLAILLRKDVSINTRFQAIVNHYTLREQFRVVCDGGMHSVVSDSQPLTPNCNQCH